MKYIESNKAAWEEAFEHRQPNWGDKNYERLGHESLPFLHEDFQKELKAFNLTNASIAQFGCNNGRELLSLMQLGASNGVGFDIAENIIEQAKRTAQQANIHNCSFVCCSILDIPEQNKNAFDYVFFTIGALTWFKDLRLLFEKVAFCLRHSGVVFVHDSHPVFNMLPFPGEDDYKANDLNRFVYSYFREEPWVENGGMSYMSGTYESKPFTSFSHTMGNIITSLSMNGLYITSLHEYDYDIGLTDVYDNKGMPLSFTLAAKKF